MRYNCVFNFYFFFPTICVGSQFYKKYWPYMIVILYWSVHAWKIYERIYLKLYLRIDASDCYPLTECELSLDGHMFSDLLKIIFCCIFRLCNIEYIGYRDLMYINISWHHGDYFQGRYYMNRVFTLNIFWWFLVFGYITWYPMSYK